MTERHAATSISRADVEDIVAAAADEFVERLEAGDSPDVEDYAHRYPELSDMLRRTLDALRTVHQMTPFDLTALDGEPTSGRCGRTFGDYRIVREIGRGGMGVVYEAEQLSLQRRVALKVLPFAGVLDPRQLARFKNEALAAARLEHPHIVDVHAVGCERAVHFYAMQFIDGHNLAEVIGELRRLAGAESDTPVAAPDGSIPCQADTALLGGLSTAGSVRTPLFFRTVARLGIEAAEALDYAHQHGIVHRDIKPSNLMLDSRGKLWITDFGLAQVESDAGVTMSGDILGTLRYMSPEQALGHRRLIDHRSDIYSLGATLYELLTLRPVFTETDRQKLLQQIACAEPSLPRRLNQSIPADLETILLRALAREPRERYPTARELADDLRRYLDDKPISARRARWPRRIIKWLRRHPSLLWSGALSLVLMVAALSVATLLIWRSQRLTETALNDARELKQQAETDRDVAQRRLLEARLAQARASRRSGRVGGRQESLAALMEAARLVRQLNVSDAEWLTLRSEAAASLALFDAQPLRQWTCPAEYWPAFDADLELCAAIDGGGNVIVQRVDGDAEPVLLPGPATSYGFSPDGALLLACDGAELVVWDWRAKAVVVRIPFSDDPQRMTCFSPDGQRLAVARSNGVMDVHDAADGRRLTQIETGVSPSQVAYSPDGGRLAVSSYAGRGVQVRNATTGDLLRSLAVPPGAWSVAWHPNGRLLAGSSNDFSIHVWDVITGAEHAVLRGHDAAPHGLQFTRAGDVLSSWSWDGTVRLWNAETGEELLRIPAFSGWLSADGRRVAGRFGRTLQVWELARAEVYRTLATTSASVNASLSYTNPGRISPDGRWLAVPGRPQGIGGVALYDLRGGEPLALLPRAEVALFHPRGREVFVSGQGGVVRWPLRVEGEELHIGPPDSLVTAGRGELATDASGRYLVCADWHSGAEVFDLDQPQSAVLRLAHPGCGSVAITGDARWIATGTRNGRGVRMWERATGKLVRELIPEGFSASVRFTPDSRWLVTSNLDEAVFWSVDSWEQRRRIVSDGNVRPTVAVSRDGRWLAATAADDQIRLEDFTTGRPLVNLEAPNGPPVHWMDFTPDAAQLVVVGAKPSNVRVWDLRKLRQELHALDLDWEGPAYPSGDVAPQAPVRVRVELE